MAKHSERVATRSSGEADRYTDLYRTLLLIRRFEEEVHRLFMRGEVYGSTHLCIGQEAVSVGVCSQVGERDWLAATYRGHGHCLALGTAPVGLMGEMLGRAIGTCGGRAGSMNVIDHSHRLIGCFGIVGGSMAAATGGALALRGTGGAAVALFGDGTANQAYFHECLNFAQVHRLPAVFVCENNQYGEYTPTAHVTPGGILARPKAMGIPAERVDGNDLWAMLDATSEALDRARSGQGPAFLEANTYRFSDHGRGDPVDYRAEGEVEKWKARDPLTVARRRLVDEWGVEEEDLDRIAQEVEGEIKEVVAEALDAPFPEPGSTMREFKGEPDVATQFRPALR